jgi:magnesium transporter
VNLAGAAMEGSQGTLMQHVARDVPRARSTARAGDVREGLAGKLFESATEVAVCDGERLAGLVPIERLLAAAAETTLGEIADPVRAVAGDADEELAAAQLVRAGGRSLAVVDELGRLEGLLPPQPALQILWREHEEDVARLGGFLVRSSRARTASEEPVGRRLWHRLPWLAVGLLGAMASAAIVASYEEELKRQVLLAFFVPAVVYMADAVGTQTEALVIRGISVGVSARAVIGRELITGLVIGAMLGAAFFPFAFTIWGDARVAATVALALFGSTSTATVVAMGLPYALNGLGRDPAFGSGPLATVIQDLLSILIYFAIAVTLAP